MKSARRAYYDRFSRFYDRFIALHSRDKLGLARTFLADQIPVSNCGLILDLCTGTGTLLTCLHSKAAASGHVVGLDFSHGMLTVAKGKTGNLSNVSLVEADAGALPFAAGTFDAVTCSHAFYELKGKTQTQALEEIVRILKPSGIFLMMEHDVPSNPVVKALFYLRLTFIGGGRVVAFLRQERDVLEQYFAKVEKVPAPAGRSKIMVCRKIRNGPSSGEQDRTP